MLNEENLKFFTEALSFWKNLTQVEQELLVINTALVKYSQYENVYSASNECVGVLIIKSGELRTYMLSEKGKEITLYRLNKGEICVLSASCLLKNITFDVHIDAERESEVFLINSSVFSKLISENVYVENFSLRVVVDKFSDVMWAMEQILFMSFDRRLAIFLLDESARSGDDTITLTHEQIAKYMGSAREVVSRMVKYFAKEGIIETHRGGIRIIDKARFRKYMLEY